MPTPNLPLDPTGVLLIVLGAFYAFAGVVAARAALMSNAVDVAIAAIANRRPSRTETALTIWLAANAVVVLASGVALVLRFDLAAWLFIAAALGQAIYLAVLAPMIFDRDDPPSPAGRRATINAFVLYCAATAIVLWAWMTERLMPWAEAAPLLLAAAGAVLAAFAGYVVWTLLRPLNPSDPKA